MASACRSSLCSDSSTRSNTCAKSVRTAEISLMERSSPKNKAVSSDLVGRSLTSDATPECLDALSSPSEPADEAEGRHLGSGRERGAEPEPRGAWPNPSMFRLSSGSARNLFMDPVEGPFLGRDLPVLFRIFCRVMAGENEWLDALKSVSALELERSTSSLPHAETTPP